MRRIEEVLGEQERMRGKGEREKEEGERGKKLLRWGEEV